MSEWKPPADAKPVDTSWTPPANAVVAEPTPQQPVAPAVPGKSQAPPAPMASPSTSVAGSSSVASGAGPIAEGPPATIPFSQKPNVAEEPDPNTSIFDKYSGPETVMPGMRPFSASGSSTRTPSMMPTAGSGGRPAARAYNKATEEEKKKAENILHTYRTDFTPQATRDKAEAMRVISGDEAANAYMTEEIGRIKSIELPKRKELLMGVEQGVVADKKALEQASEALKQNFLAYQEQAKADPSLAPQLQSQYDQELSDLQGMAKSLEMEASQLGALYEDLKKDAILASGYEYLQRAKTGSIKGATWNNLLNNVGSTVAGANAIPASAILAMSPATPLPGETQEQADRRVKNKVLSAMREVPNEAIGDSGTTPEYIQEMQDTFLGGAWLSGSGTIPLALMGPAGLGMIFNAADGVRQEMSAPEFDNIPEWKKEVFSNSVGLVIGMLEKYGIQQAMGGGTMARSIMANAVSKLPQNATTADIKAFLLAETESVAARYLARIGGGSLSEAGTEFQQGLIEPALKEVFDMVEEKNLLASPTGDKGFKSPTSLGEVVKDALVQSAQGAVMGGMMATPGAMLKHLRDSSVGKTTNDTQFELTEQLLKDPEFLATIKEDLARRVEDKDITQTEADETISAWKEAQQIVSKIPEDLQTEKRREAFDLLTQKAKLAKMDKALVGDKVAAIDAKLMKLAGVESKTEGETKTAPTATQADIDAATGTAEVVEPVAKEDPPVFGPNTFGEKEDSVSRIITDKTGESFTLVPTDSTGPLEKLSDGENDGIGLIIQNADGEMIGSAGFVKDGNGEYRTNNIFINPEHRNKGIATEVYKYIGSLGVKHRPSMDQTEDGSRLWKPDSSSAPPPAPTPTQATTPPVDPNEDSEITLDEEVDGDLDEMLDEVAAVSDEEMAEELGQVAKSIKGKLGTDVVVLGPEEYAAAVANAGGGAANSGSDGFFMDADNTVYINRDKFRRGVTAHEGTHAAIYAALGGNPEGRAIVASAARQALGVSPEFRERMVRFLKYYGGAKTNQDGTIDVDGTVADPLLAEEVVSEFVAQIYNGTVKLDTPTKQFLRDLYNRIMAALGISTKFDPKTDSDFLSMAKQLASAMKAGREISTAKKAGGSGTGVGPKYSRLAARTPGTKARPYDHKLAAVDPAAVDMDAMSDKALQKAADKLAKYPGMRIGGGSAKVRIAKAIDRMVGNILYLHDSFPEKVRELAKEWYVGANKVSVEWADRYGVTPAQTAGVIAALSPQKDWFTNMSLAERVLEFVANHKDHRWDSTMSDRAKKIRDDYADKISRAKESLAKNPNNDNKRKELRSYESAVRNLDIAIPRISGKVYNTLTTGNDKAWFLRIWDEANNDQSFNQYLPTGERTVIQRNKAPKATKKNPSPLGVPSKIAWQSAKSIAAAIDIAENGTSIDVVSQGIGEAHKVRSFYNNIFDPSSPDFTTIDTHAMAAAMFLPLSGKSSITKEGFGGLTDSASGHSGLYPIYQRAYEIAARQRGILPREMQSITWEAVRGLFEKGQKAGAGSSASDVWKSMPNDPDGARSAVSDLFGGISNPAWLGSESGLSTGPKFSKGPATQSDFKKGNLQNLLDKSDWVIMTAENPSKQKLSDAQNAERMADLMADLDDMGAKYTPVDGKYGNEEKSLAITGVNEKQAIELGKKYGQESVLTRKGLVYQDGTYNPATGVTELDSKPDDFFSVANGQVFQIDIDFDKKLSGPKFSKNERSLGDRVEQTSGDVKFFQSGGDYYFSTADGFFKGIPETNGKRISQKDYDAALSKERIKQAERGGVVKDLSNRGDSVAATSRDSAAVAWMDKAVASDNAVMMKATESASIAELRGVAAEFGLEIDPNKPVKLALMGAVRREINRRKRDGTLPSGPKFSKATPGKNRVPQEHRDNLTDDGKGNYVFFHKGPAKLKGGKIDPAYFGTGKTKDNRSNPVMNYYTKPDQSERMIKGDVMYAVPVPKWKVYPLMSDPLDLYDKAEANFRKKFGKDQAFDAVRQADFIGPLAEKAGFDMMIAGWSMYPLRAESGKSLAPDAKLTKKYEEEGTVDLTKSVDPYYEKLMAKARADRDKQNAKEAKGFGGPKFSKNKTALSPVTDPRIERVLGGRKMIDESAEDRSRKSAKFTAKDGQDVYLSRSTDSTNPGVRAYVLDGDNSLKPIGSMAVDADQLDNGFVVPASGTRQQSLKVSDKYRRLGVGNAMLDFSEQTYGKPLDVRRIPSSEPISDEAASLFASRDSGIKFSGASPEAIAKALIARGYNTKAKAREYLKQKGATRILDDVMAEYDKLAAKKVKPPTGTEAEQADQRQMRSSAKRIKEKYPDLFKALGDNTIRYDRMPMTVSRDAASELIGWMGVENAMVEVLDRSSDLPSAVRSMMGQMIVRRLSDEHRLKELDAFAEKFLELGTSAGQFINAFRDVMPEFSKEMFFYRINKMVKGQVEKRKSKDKNYKKLRDGLEKVNKEVVETVISGRNVKQKTNDASAPQQKTSNTEKIKKAWNWDNNKVVKKDRKAEILKALRGTFNTGPNPLHVELAAGYIEAGARTFAAVADIVATELGNKAVPYFKDAYKKAFKFLKDQGVDAGDPSTDAEIDAHIAEVATKDMVERLKKAIASNDKKTTAELIGKLQQASKDFDAWDVYREYAMTRLKRMADRDIAEDMQANDDVREFADGLVRNIADQMKKEAEAQGLAPKTPKTPKSAIEIIGDAYRNFDKYEQVWKDTQAEWKRRLNAAEARLAKADNPEAKAKAQAEVDKERSRLEKLDAYYGNLMVKPFSEATMGRAVKDGMKQLDLKIDDIIRQHYTVYEAAKRTLAEKLVQDAGLTHPEATKLANAVSAEFERMANDRKKALVDQYAKRKFGDKKASKAERKGIEDELIFLTNTGAFSDEDFIAKYGDMRGWPKLSKENIKEIERLADRVQSAPEGRPKLEAIEDLLGYQANIAGVSKWEIAQSVWYANMLSGYETQEVNFLANQFNLFMEMGVAAAQKPKDMAHIARAVAYGFKRGYYEAGAVMRTGYSPIRGRVDIPPALERIKFDYAKMYNGLKYVRRVMVAADVLAFEPLKELRAFQYAAVKARSSDPSAIDRQRALDIVNRNDADVQAATDQAQAEYEAEIKSINDSGVTGAAKKKAEDKAERDRKRRVFELVEKGRDEEVVQESVRFAAQSTYNRVPEGALGSVAKGVNLVLKEIPALRYGMPFVNIIANVANEALNYYPPVGIFRAIAGGPVTDTIMRRANKGMTEEQKAMHKADLITKAAIGTVLMGLMWIMSEPGDDDDPLIEVTGNGYNNYRQNSEMESKGLWKPYSFRVRGTDTWISYQYTPLIFTFGLMGHLRDAVKYRKEQPDDTAMTKYAVALKLNIGTLFDSSFLSSTASVLNWLDSSTDDDMQRAVGSLAKTVKAMVVPYSAMINQVQQNLDSLYDIPKMDARGSLTAELIKNTPVAYFVRDNYPVILDALGDPIVPTGGFFRRFAATGDPAPNSVQKMFLSAPAPDRLWSLMVDKKYPLSAPNRNTVTVYDPKKEDRRIMTEDELFTFYRVRGEAIKRFVNDNFDNLSKLDNKEFAKRMKSKGAEATDFAKAAATGMELENYRIEE